MSAAEKLKALEARTRADEDAMGELSIYAPWLLTSWPQLIAVVEAAERSRSEYLFKGELAEALDALDEALGEK